MKQAVLTNRSSSRRARVVDYLSLERNVAIASTAVFLLGSGEELWKKFVPKYLEALGATTPIIGLFGTAEDFFDAVYQYPGGWIADHLGRRRAFLIFIALSSAGYVVYLFSPWWPLLFVAAPAAAAPAQDIGIDTKQIDQIMGQSGKVNGGVYQFSVPRADKIMDNEMEIPPAMGIAQAINFQPTGGGKAAITGDFVLLASEVNPVIKALRDNGIEVTALHSHMLVETPHLFFMHFWANDDALKLARGIRAALDKTNVVKG